MSCFGIIIFICAIIIISIIVAALLGIEPDKCPYCASTDIEQSEFYGWSHEETYYRCNTCKKTFDKPKSNIEDGL